MGRPEGNAIEGQCLAGIDGADGRPWGVKMEVGWSELVCSPDDEAVAELKRSWAWLIPQPWTPLLYSVLGDVFLERQRQGVFWLNTGTGEVTRVAEDVQQFETSLRTDLAEDWFMPQLIACLHQAGKIPNSGQCYTYVIFPIFADGRYEVENLNVVPAKEHFGLSGDLHAQISGLPDGQKVSIVWDKKPIH